jgi:formylglycine-generating enzyme
MKTIITASFILIGLLSYSQINIKEIDGSLAKVDDKLYASKYEVSNKLYMDFIRSLKSAGKKEELAIAIIDSLQWKEKLAYNEPYVEYYHTHPAYANYPVVNISHKGALLFCEWLTKAYNADAKRKFKKVLFRLPTEKEWVKAAQGGDSAAIYPWKGTDLNNKKGMYVCNFSRPNDALSNVAGNLNDAADITAPVKSYYPNNFGLYNMSGNVAEMIAEPGIIKGGGWRDHAEAMRIDSKATYDGKPRTTVGFRYFAEIIEK